MTPWIPKQHINEAVVIGFFLMFALYAMGFAAGYFTGAHDEQVRIVAMADIARDGFRGTFFDSPGNSAWTPCWSSVDLAGSQR